MDRGITFGADFIGKALLFRSSDDPPDSFVYELDDEPVAELWWSREDGAVRMETEAGVCRIGFSGLLFLTGGVLVGEDEVLQARYRGGIRRGRALMWSGRAFDFFHELDRTMGPWRGIDDAEGVGVVRVQPRLDRDHGGSEVLVTPRELYAPFIGPLLALHGGLTLLQRVRPWLGMTTALSRVVSP